MSKNKGTKSHVSIQVNRNPPTNVNSRAHRAKSADPARLSRGQKQNMPRIEVEPKSLDEAGYQFNQNGKLVRIDNGQPFEFAVCSNQNDNQRRYNVIGRLVDQYVYYLLEKSLKLRCLPIPRQPKPNEPTSFFFASEDVIQTDYLMIIIHGMGVVRAGQWSRSLIINENLKVGSQLEYIERAQQLGYGVVVTNTNLNIDESSAASLSSPRRIRGSGSAEEHGSYVWENYIRQCRASHICIVAHSYGGAVVLELAHKYTTEFAKRVFAVALTDSPMKAYTKRANSNVLKMLQPRTINWIADGKPVDTPGGTRDYGQLRSAGHTLHEWTSYTSFQAIFRFFHEKRQEIERSER